MKWVTQKNKYGTGHIVFNALLFCLLFFCANGYTQSVGSVFSDEEVIDVAEANLSDYLNRISVDPPAFGFNNTSEFDLIEIGHPYERQVLTDYFKSDSIFIQSERYFYSKGEWFVPLYVNDTVRSFMFITLQNDELRYMGGGEKPFAVEVEITEKYYGITENLKRSFLFPEDHSGPGNCGYIMAYDSLARRYLLYPIITGFEDYCKLYYAPFEQYYSFSNYFISYHSGEYYNPEPKSQIVAHNWYFFPNPFSDELYMQTPVERLNAEGVTVKFYTLNGKQLFDETIGNNSLFEYPVPMTVFPSEGIYLYTISDGDTINTGKVVKLE